MIISILQSTLLQQCVTQAEPRIVILSILFQETTKNLFREGEVSFAHGLLGSIPCFVI
jgi:hypothetical protein